MDANLYSCRANAHKYKGQRRPSLAPPRVLAAPKPGNAATIYTAAALAAASGAAATAAAPSLALPPPLLGDLVISEQTNSGAWLGAQAPPGLALLAIVAANALAVAGIGAMARYLTDAAEVNVIRVQVS